MRTAAVVVAMLLAPSVWADSPGHFSATAAFRMEGSPRSSASRRRGCSYTPLRANCDRGHGARRMRCAPVGNYANRAPQGLEKSDLRSERNRLKTVVLMGGAFPKGVVHFLRSTRQQ